AQVLLHLRAELRRGGGPQPLLEVMDRVVERAGRLALGERTRRRRGKRARREDEERAESRHAIAAGAFAAREQGRAGPAHAPDRRVERGGEAVHLGSGIARGLAERQPRGEDANGADNAEREEGGAHRYFFWEACRTCPISS